MTAIPQVARDVTVIGLDIGTNLIKVVEMRSARGSVHLLNLGIRSTPPEVISNGVIVDPTPIEPWERGIERSRRSRSEVLADRLDDHKIEIEIAEGSAADRYLLILGGEFSRAGQFHGASLHPDLNSVAVAMVGIDHGDHEFTLYDLDYDVEVPWRLVVCFSPLDGNGDVLVL